MEEIKNNSIHNNAEMSKKGKKETSVYDSNKEWLERRNKKILKMQMDEVNSKFEDEQSKFFKPRINNSSKKRLRGSNFYERQRSYQKKKMEKLKKLDKQKNSYTFKPRLNSNKDELVKESNKKKKMRKSDSVRGPLGSTFDVRTMSKRPEMSTLNTRYSYASSKKQSRNSAKASKKISSSRERAFKTAEIEMRKSKRSVSKRLYQTPGKENKPLTIIAKKPMRRSRKSLRSRGSNTSLNAPQKPVVVEETKIVAKIRNKELRRKIAMEKQKFDRIRRDIERKIKDNGIIVHGVPEDPDIGKSFRRLGEEVDVMGEFEIFESSGAY